MNIPKIPHIFVAGMATEVNTFAPIFIDTDAFADALLARPHEHPETPTLCTSPLIHARTAKKQGRITLTEGTTCWADPAGLVNRSTYETIRDEILQQLADAQQKSAVDGVILCLHGAMVAQGYEDPEGDIITRVRAMVGDSVIIAVGLDPHSHLTQKRVAGSDIMVAFKEFPHTDFSERGAEVLDLCLKAVAGTITPQISVFDCKMIDIFPTSHPKMQAFVDKMQALEQDASNPVLSISLIHGFMAGDVPEMGTKMMVVTDDDRDYGDTLAQQLGMEIFALRGVCAPEQRNEKDSLDMAVQYAKTSQSPIVVADMWDNPGGGVAGDATVILKQALQDKLTNIAFATIWDPIAVKLCRVAGQGATIPLRFGGKSAPHCGDPVDGVVTVKKVVPNATQTFCESVVPLGDSVLIDINGIDVILNTVRSQVFERTVFTAFDLNLMDYDILVVKSTNHFYGDFAKLTDTILYCDAGKPYPNKPSETDYRYAPQDIWPMVDNPHSQAIFNEHFFN